MKRYFLFFLILLNSTLSAQNLIPNPGFEEKEMKDYDKGGKIFRAKDWDWIQPRGKYGWWQYPWSGLHIDKTMLPYIDSLLCQQKTEKAFITIYPYEGNCYMRSLGCKFKNIIQTKLKQPLRKGVVYYFEMYYRVDGMDYKREKAEPFSINRADFGVVFRDKNSFEQSFMKDLYQDKIMLRPNLPIKLNDSLPIKQWTKFTAYFIPTMDYSYFLIGNFRDLGQNIAGVWQGISNFYIDNLYLTPYENMLAKDLQSVNKPFVLEGIYFNDKEAVFQDKSVYTLDILFNFLKNNPNKKLEINCYMIKDKENSLLPKQRAEAVAGFMTKSGINANRISTFGKEEVVPPNKKLSKTDQMKMNRIEITIKQ